MAYVEIRNIGKVFLSKKHKHIIAIDDVSLNMDRGEFYCLVGPSGCGKSTLLRIMDGLIEPSKGEILIGGKVIDQPGFDRGMVFQQFNLLPWRTVLGNIEFGLENRGVPKSERRERAMRYINMVGLEVFVNSYPSQLSGGMQQRVGLARALVIEPEILLMDEPFGALDAQTREIMQAELTQIWSIEKRTVLFVTHDIEEASFLADRVIIMSSRPGRIVDIIDVPFPRPRDNDLRTTAEFAALRGQISRVMSSGIAEQENVAEERSES
jgi:NitT/TauT family transport system ATP-binding protein